MPGLFLIFGVDIFRFPASFSRFFLIWPGGVIPPEMVALSARVMALSRITVPAVMMTARTGVMLTVLLLGPLIRLPGLCWLLYRCVLAARVLPWLV